MKNNFFSFTFLNDYYLQVKHTTMRYLFVLLLLVGCSGNCGSIDGLEVPDMSKVPGDYTGVAFSCYHGRLQTNNYKDGKKDGISRRWYDPTRVSGHILEFEENYKDGKEDGVFRYWWYNGQLEFEVNYKDGKEDGVFRYWFENGQLRHKKNYKDGKIIDNKIVNYNEDGSIYNTEYYEDGKLVRCEGWC